jgi:PTS system nitrogen regulatory IIA component
MGSSFPFPDVVLKSLRAHSPRDVLRQMMEALELAQGVDGAALVAPLMNAEQTGGSAIGDGAAVVSVRVPRKLATHRYCAFAQLHKPINFRGVENHPCDLVFVLISPEDETQAHLRDLSAVVRTLRDRDFLDRLRSMPTAERMSGLFRARDIAKGQAAA